MEARAVLSERAMVASPAHCKEVWSRTPYHDIAPAFVLMGELLCEAVGVHPGDSVLDVATGTGNTALAGARRRGNVVGVDLLAPVLERGRRRAAAEGLAASFLAADAQALPFADASFDVVLSTLGVMFAPDQSKAAGELVRVCKPGGRIGMTNWTPRGWTSEFSSVCAGYAPAVPLRKVGPFRWGAEEGVGELLGPSVSLVHVERRTYRARYRSVDECVEQVRAFALATPMLYGLDGARQAALTKDLTALVARFNCSPDSSVVVHQEYLELVGVKLGPGDAGQM